MTKNNTLQFQSSWLIILLLGFLLFSATLAQASPVLFFSDLTSGPNTGGLNNKGVFVTIWGNNFGRNRAGAVITVGSGPVDNYQEWSNTKICFQLGPKVTSGAIVVKNATGQSNGLPFTVRQGNIYFVTPNGTGNGSFSHPFAPADYTAKLAAGEKGATAYFRTGVYASQYAAQNWHANFCLGARHSGAIGQENAFIAFPGEKALLRTSDSTGADRNNFRVADDPAQYIVTSKFHCYAKNGSIGGHTGWRIIGNKVNAIHVNSASGSIGTGLYQDRTQHHIYIYGNEISGGSSGNKLDHAIYPGSGINSLYVGWNYIHDNNFAAGPMISLNCNQAYAKNLVSKNIYFHDNIIDVSTYPARAMGVYETGRGSEIFFYNNLIIGPAPNGQSSFYAMSGKLHYFHNTFFHGGSENLGSVMAFYSSTVYNHLYAPESIEIKNNLLFADSKSSYYIKTSRRAPAPVVANNLFYNINAPRNRDQYTRDKHRIVADPMFENSAAHDFSIQSSSPALRHGQTLPAIPRDLAGQLRHHPPAIGAYEGRTGITTGAVHLLLQQKKHEAEEE